MSMLPWWIDVLELTESWASMEIQVAKDHVQTPAWPILTYQSLIYARSTKKTLKSCEQFLIFQIKRSIKIVLFFFFKDSK